MDGVIRRLNAGFDSLFDGLFEAVACVALHKDAIKLCLQSCQLQDALVNQTAGMRRTQTRLHSQVSEDHSHSGNDVRCDTIDRSLQSTSP